VEEKKKMYKNKLDICKENINRLANLYNRCETTDGKIEYSQVAGLIIRNSNFPDNIKSSLLERFLEIITRGVEK